MQRIMRLLWIIDTNKLDNIEGRTKFLEIYNLPRLNSDEIENLTRPIIIKEIESEEKSQRMAEW